MVVDLEYSEDQLVSISRIEEWLKGSSDLTMGGYAGSGKTSVLQHLAPKFAEAGAVVMAPTGKASQVLRSKGIEATTIHRLIYHFKGTSEDQYGRESPIFSDHGTWATDDDVTPKLLVCDEASLVNQTIYDDIRRRKIPTLWVGDHGQLAPVGGDPGLMRNPDIKLERIHRQAENNSILNLAYRARLGHVPTIKDSSNNVCVTSFSNNDAIISMAIENDCDQILVATNQLRHIVNSLYRKNIKYNGVLTEGDRLMCIHNDYQYSMFNGQMFRVDKIGRTNKDIAFVKLSEDTINGWSPLDFYVPLQLSALGNPEYKSRDKVPGSVLFDYGYAMSVHKSQGSEYGNVLLVYQNIPMFSMPRWSYTGITRAKNHLSIIIK